ncbi:hypothetical protein [Umezakia ovalisporum]|jgi:hypothetical protein|uniref:DUF4007 family protein n=1 Tax=Umezakia ovalisporum FSS-62 TaxID=2971776 RepID=A0AA43GVB2_9CYAN|nr:hypothetical protein [Umezakia ovalisporum]MBI1240660.1 hypothetical protein [Nostoc sp. RI_552]MDH6062419.1 DUF4007 family protein [Umezakia ovalisporum FSS-62]MDH6066789.1 DUF4007 family protein [Umezakia ovalisporum APH033B]MDH6084817.1 DUF4007 family protein [Umezakia ovalisporum TAC611]MDH6089450.1 DUF4007 family protein [Umezakia ovalisporum Ak1311]
MAKLQLHFNGSFSLKKDEISRLIRAADDEKGLNDSLSNLMEKTSLGNAKVGRIKSWAVRGGLIKNNRPSPEGKVVLGLDPSLESNITDWLIHFYLSFGCQGLKPTPKNPADWGGWPYFIYTFLPRYSKFVEADLAYHTTLIFPEENKVIAQRIKFILRAYTEFTALASCKFVTQEKDKYYCSGYPCLPNPYLLGYFLAQLWERDFSREGSVLTESILNQKMGLAAVLGIKADALQQQLNAMEAYGIIEQQRAVPPFQVTRRWDQPLALLEKAYEA